MPRLVHVNGPPGIGKSTLARRYVDDHRLAFCLDIDGFRALIGGWAEHEQESGRLARRMALAMAREHLCSGYDVVVPQFVARPQFVHELHETAAQADARFHEVVLLDSLDVAEARFHARAHDPAWGEHHRAAARMIDRSGGFRSMYAKLVTVIEDLPDAVTLTTAGDVESTYQRLLAVLEGDSSGV